MELDAPLEAELRAQDSRAVLVSGFSEYRKNSAEAVQAARRARVDLDYENQEGIRDVLSAVRDRAPLIFVSGRAGTGKSRLIEYLRGLPDGERQVVVAPTGVSALALKASTIHAMFRLPIGVIDAESLRLDDPPAGPLLRKMSRLVIDEVGMVRADLLDGIDVRLQAARADDRPFGGVQVVLVGDFLQLPPVVRDEDREILERLGYETPFAFSSRVMRRTPVRIATLRKVWRQSDPAMIAALGAIREGRNAQQAIEWLNERCAREHRANASPVILTATRVAAEMYNREGLSALSPGGESAPGLRSAMFQASSAGSFDDLQSVLPAPRQLELICGARVMAVRNDPTGSFVNGSLGLVVDIFDGAGLFEDAYVDVLFDGALCAVRVRPADWSRVKQVWDSQAGAIVETTTGVFRQIPLMIGYAMTIHKSQGLSLADVRIDLAKGAFAPGQLYVALSRARSVEGLSFVRPIELRDVKVDEMLVSFLDWTRSAENIEIGNP